MALNWLIRRSTYFSLISILCEVGGIDKFVLVICRGNGEILEMKWKNIELFCCFSWVLLAEFNALFKIEIFVFKIRLIFCFSVRFLFYFHNSPSRHIKLKKPLSPFYHKNYFWWKINVRHPQGVLHLFSIKNNFIIKWT